ncbi:MAG TPA: hypothetical protein VM029_01645 [Opitutaceae bacterium]|nr:hypothetical protein [Opitutaceae bacterium]
MNRFVKPGTPLFAMPARLCLICLAVAGLTGSGCIHVKMDPVEVNATVNVNVRMEREVAGLLSDIYGDSATIKVPTPAAK